MIEQRLEGGLRAPARGPVAHQPLCLLIHHRDPIKLVTELLRIQVGSEVAFVDRVLSAPRHQLPPVLQCLHHPFTHRMPDAVVILERGLLQQAPALLLFASEPTDRVRIGPEPPKGSLASQTIKQVAIENAPWMTPSTIPLNSGLVAIIGARGSGKTALADAIAASGLGTSSRFSDRSFLSRASKFLQDGAVVLGWESGESTRASLSIDRHDEGLGFPRVQYLSQQFVDALCSSEGLTDSLVDEVQQVIFQAHELDQREGASDFQDLYDLRCDQSLRRRTRCEEQLVAVADELLQERLLKQELPTLDKELAETKKQLDADTKDRAKLVRPGRDPGEKAAGTR